MRDQLATALADESVRLVANCSTLFRELPLLDRPAAAAAAGFEAIELWWPFSAAVPADVDVEDLIAAVEAAGVALTGLNLFAGDLAGADCGAVSVPAMRDDLLASIDPLLRIGERLGVRGFNALYGNRVDGLADEAQDELALVNLEIVATRLGSIGGTLLLEAVSGPKPYPLRTAAHVFAVVDRLRDRGVHNVAFLCDLFHLAANGDDMGASLARVDDIGHVQVADHPGRGEPGSGTLALGSLVEQLTSAGYVGTLALEYLPTTSTIESLHWLTPRSAGTGR